MSTKHHSVKFPGCDLTARESGKNFAHFRFDAMIEFFEGFLDELRLMAEKDRVNGKQSLARVLFDAVDRIPSVLRFLRVAWRISKPHMQDELSTELEERWFKELNKQTSGVRRLTDALLARG